MRRQYRFLRVCHLYYQDALPSFFAKYPGIEKREYSYQIEKLLGEKLNNGNAFSLAMRKLGHESNEIVYDVEVIQKKWAEENSIVYSRDRWIEEIVLAQIKHYKPEILYFQHFPPLPFSIWRNLKEICPSIKKIVIHRAWPGDWDEVGAADLLLVGTRQMVRQYQSHRHAPRLLYHYFDETVLEMLDKSQAPIEYELTFLGSSGLGYGILHSPRYWLLLELLKKTDIRMWLDEPTIPKSHFMKKCKEISRDFVGFWLGFLSEQILESILLKYKDNSRVNRLVEDCISKKKGLMAPKKRLRNLYPNRCFSPVYGMDYYKILANSVISLQKHIHTAEGDVGAIRLFQATGVGSCMLTDTGNNLGDLFEDGKEVLTYSGTGDALDKIKYLIENPIDRQAIALAGQKRTMKDHTAIKRCEQIEEWLNEIL